MKHDTTIWIFLTLLMFWVGLGLTQGTKSGSEAQAYHKPSTQLAQQQVATLKLIEEAIAPEELADTVALIGLQETRLGTYGANEDGVIVGDHHRPFGARSYGKWQMQLKTARDILNRHPELGSYPTDEGLIAALLYNDRFAVSLCAHHVSWLQKHTDDWEHTVLAYNRGLSGSRDRRDPMNYLAGIQRKRLEILLPYKQGNYAIKE